MTSPWEQKVPIPFNSRARRPAFSRLAFNLLLAIFFCSAWPALAQADATLQAKVKVAYVFNFIKFVEWPSLETADPGEPIRVGIIGKDPTTVLLEELAGRQVKGRPLVVEHYAADAGKPIDCHLLFISQAEQRRLPQVLKQVAPTGVLTVSDIARFSSRGGVVGFVMEDGRVKIEVNLRAARQSSLKISAKLLEVAKVIQ